MRRTQQLLIALYLLLVSGYLVIFLCHLTHCVENKAPLSTWVICFCHGVLFTAHLGMAIMLFIFGVDVHKGLSCPNDIANEVAKV